MMRQNLQSDKQSLTPLQKQAVLVCIVCALAALLTIGITLNLLRRGKDPVDTPSPDSTVTDDGDLADHYQINETSSALLTETADAGDAYQNETLFLGDSNTVRLYANGLISLQQFCAKEGIGTSAALNDGIVAFKKDNTLYTMAQAVAKMKPRRVVIMLGTNDNSMSTEDFISNYTALVQAIQASYPYADIIVNTVPPVPENHSNYPNMDQARIDDFNMALLSMCEQLGVKFLNTAEVLKDATGYGNADYYQSGDIHLKTTGLKVLLNYLRTHAYETEDRRPDTSGVPTRAEYTFSPSSAVAAPSSSESASSSEAASSSEETVEYKASYRVDKTGGGTLSANGNTGKALTCTVTGASQSVSVTAVPDEGYVFVKWSDGSTQKTRTDTNFKQDLDVTAVFAAASVKISGDGKAVVGGHYTFKAKLSGKYLDAGSLRWYCNGAEVATAAGQTTVTVPITQEMQGTTFKVYAVASYNDSRVTSNALDVTVAAAASGSSSGSSGSSSSSSASSGSGSNSTEETGTSNGTAASGSHSTSGSGSTSSSSHSTSGSGSTSSSSSSSHSTSASGETAGSSSHSTSASGSSSQSTASSSSSSSHSTASSGSASSSSHSESASSSHSERSSAHSPAPEIDTD